MNTNGFFLNSNEISLICDALKQYADDLNRDTEESACAPTIIANVYTVMRIRDLLGKIADAVRGANTPTIN